MQQLIRFVLLLLPGLIMGSFFLTSPPQEYPGFLSQLPMDVAPDSKAGKIAFKAIQVLMGLSLATYLVVLVDLYGHTTWRITVTIKRWLDNTMVLINNNARFITQYHKSLPIAMAFYFACAIYLLLTVPYHYDEAWSYNYFTGVGALRSATFYPLPNNHILYNIIASWFTCLPIDARVASRLPNLIASLIAVLYFIKLCARYFSTSLTVIIAFLLATTSPFLLYGIQARGYGFLVCFAVLQLYAANNLVDDYNQYKQRMLYYLAFIGGLYAVPSYLYFVFPVHLLLFLFLLFRKNLPFKTFIKDNLVTLAVLIVLYGIVIHFNGSRALLKPNDTPAMEYSQLGTALWQHLNTTWRWLTNIKLPYLAGIAILAAGPVVYMIKNKLSWLPTVSLLLIISPIGIIYLHRVIAFERTWVYLIVPFAAAIGFLIHALLQVTPGIAGAFRTRPWRQPAALLVLFIVVIFNIQVFRQRNVREMELDYSTWESIRKAGPEISQASTLYYSRETLEFYITEQILFVRKTENPRRPLTVTYEQPTYQEDILVINPNKQPAEMPELTGYKLMGAFQGYYALYIKKRP